MLTLLLICDVPIWYALLIALTVYGLVFLHLEGQL